MAKLVVGVSIRVVPRLNRAGSGPIIHNVDDARVGRRRSGNRKRRATRIDRVRVRRHHSGAAFLDSRFCREVGDLLVTVVRIDGRLSWP